MMVPVEQQVNPNDVPEPVVNFIKWLQHYLSLNEIYHVENMYEDGFYKLSGIY